MGQAAQKRKAVEQLGFDPATVQPMNDRVLLKRLEETPSGLIIIPDVAQSAPTRCKVIAVGPGRKDEKTGRRIPMEVKPGDTVLIGPWNDWEKFEDHGYVICQEADIRVRENG